MVQTRRQWRQWVDNGFRSRSPSPEPDYEHGGFTPQSDQNDEVPDEEEGPCSECEDAVPGPNGPGGPVRPCNRHRPRDNDPFTVVVPAHRRRVRNR